MAVLFCWFPTYLILLVINMFLPYRLLATELQRSSCWSQFVRYEKASCKYEINNRRIDFLTKCKHSEIVPKFLKFRIPNNGCFDNKSVREFQLKLLLKELQKAKSHKQHLQEQLSEKIQSLRHVIPEKLLPSVVLYVRAAKYEARRKQQATHNKKLAKLSEEQERPLFKAGNTVVLHQLDSTPPQYVLDTLSLGPKNPVLDRFNPKEVLAEVDLLLAHCKEINVPQRLMTEINLKTLNYIKKCSKLKSARNITMTSKYLKEKDLIAVPFDKGVGICLMKRSIYNNKVDTILRLPQFEKYVKPRSNAKHPLLKEQERIIDTLKELRDAGQINNTLYRKLKPRGSQPARLYGLAKVHKTNTPIRPVLSMPGSCYFKIAEQVADWLSIVDECKINASTEKICEKIKSVNLEEGEELISFDVVSLYTNVPVLEAIEVCTELLYSGKYEKPPVNKETFKTLAKIGSCDVFMLTHDGYYKQTDGLAMGSPPAPHLANGWLSQFDDKIQDTAKIYFRYMDDIIREIASMRKQEKLAEINSLHHLLKFTMEEEENGKIAMLDMKITNNDGHLSSTWYNKPTDTGLILNYHGLAPKRYKRSVVSGFVYRIYRSCSNWANFHQSLERAKKVLERNQYPPDFYEPVMKRALDDIRKTSKEGNRIATEEVNTETPSISKKLLFVQYRGKASEDFARALHKIEAPCTTVFTMRKLRSILPSLKPAVEKEFRGSVVYKLCCSRCSACYVGQTDRHFCTRLIEHQQRRDQPVYRHFEKCRVKLDLEDTEIIATTTRGVIFLETLEALWIEELKPKINTKEEYRQRHLTIRLSSGL